MNPTIFPFTQNIVLTNTAGGAGNVEEIDGNQYWNTNAAEDFSAVTSDTANFTAKADAAKNAEARFPDGDYILPVKLPTVSTSTAAEPAEIVGITVDRFGKLFLNEHPVEWDELRQRLGSLVNQPSRPQVFLAVEDASAEVDRGLMLVRLMDMMRSLGIEEYGLVVQPAEGSVSP